MGLFANKIDSKGDKFHTFFIFGATPLIACFVYLGIYWLGYFLAHGPINEQFVSNHMGYMLAAVVFTPLLYRIFVDLYATMAFLVYGSVVGLSVLIISTRSTASVTEIALGLSIFWLLISGLVFFKRYKNLNTSPNVFNGSDCPKCAWEIGHLRKANKQACPVCLGKNINARHPHFEAIQILKKYYADLQQTTEEYSMLSQSLADINKQITLGKSGLGDALHNQAVDLQTQYKHQRNLRASQKAFFEDGISKLLRLMEKSKIAGSLLEKQKALSNLQDDNINDWGTAMVRAEELKHHHELLDRINALSIGIDDHSTTSIAMDLQAEIEALRKQL